MTKNVKMSKICHDRLKLSETMEISKNLHNLNKSKLSINIITCDQGC